MNNRQIDNLIEELYKIDASLKDYGPQLKNIITKIVEAKPDVEIDEQFKKELYEELMLKTRELKSVKINIWQRIFAKKISYAFVGVLAAVIILLGINYLIPGKIIPSNMHFLPLPSLYLAGQMPSKVA